ncbi:glycosyltransferase family 4 protein [Paenibacillus beijingensis]|uniref:Glycosyltransferase n=1 Tax=Paenibacillus beijingensis TaxID=1126833 RepID=A0A0D5NFD8_9BACL|nr:glycosyltransferase family 4 protein [Paenibacillus beijingensis]AJY73976.1 hypothetical protein VN24_04290 [Paenibacillus beijingensis]
MKILYFNTLYTPNSVGGAEKSLQLLVEYLIQKQIEPVIVTLSTEDNIDYVNGVKVYYIKHSNIYWLKDSSSQRAPAKALWHVIDILNPMILKKISAIIEAEKPEIIHTNNISGFSVAPWIAAKRRNIPVAHTLRDYNLLCVKSTMFKDNKNCSQRCGECALLTGAKKSFSNQGYVNKLIGISDFILNKHKQFGYFKDVDSVRIFNGIKLNDRVMENREKNNKEKNNKEKTVKFLFMGRIEETKGVKVILDFFNHFPEAELHLGGKIHDKSVKQQIDNNGYAKNIRFLGHIKPEEEVHKYDAVIVPSLWHEPFGRVVIEGYLYGKPIIGAKRGGISEIIQDEKTGYLFEPNDTLSLKDAINRFIKNTDRLKLSDQISEYVENFDMNILGVQYLDVYTQLLSERLYQINS